nr:methyltransferase-like protein 5 isoform X2 [Tanacetum cinerariifolium]
SSKVDCYFHHLETIVIAGSEDECVFFWDPLTTESRNFFAHNSPAENSFEDISGKVVADFRCGYGTLGLAATLLDVE